MGLTRAASGEMGQSHDLCREVDGKRSSDEWTDLERHRQLLVGENQVSCSETELRVDDVTVY